MNNNLKPIEQGEYRVIKTYDNICSPTTVLYEIETFIPLPTDFDTELDQLIKKYTKE